MSDKELIQELRKMIKLSQEDREFLESCYGGTYVYNGGNFDDTFEACVKIGATEAKVCMLDFLQQWEAKLCNCPQDLISALRKEFDIAEDFDLTEDEELQEGAIYAGTGPCTCCMCTGGNSEDVFEAGVEIGAIEAKVGMLDFLQKWEEESGMQELNDGDKVYNYSEDGLFTTDFSEVADYLEAEGQDFYFEGEAKVVQAWQLVSPQGIIEYVEERVGEIIDKDFVYSVCDRLWSEEAMIELEKLLVSHINKYLPPICEVVNVVQKELTPT